ncbi:MAG: hypothetical protein SH856_10870 [Flavobacteriales bacterium]|nr:hypothetical protein [Flavobacteriales bacterium]
MENENGELMRIGIGTSMVVSTPGNAPQRYGRISNAKSEISKMHSSVK